MNRVSLCILISAILSGCSHQKIGRRDAFQVEESASFAACSVESSLATIRLKYCTSQPWTVEKVPIFILYENGDVIYKNDSEQSLLALQYRKVRLTKEEMDQIVGMISTDWATNYPARTITDIGSLLLEIGGPSPVSIDGVFGSRAEDEEAARQICEREKSAKKPEKNDALERCYKEELKKYPPENLKRLIALISKYQNSRSEEWIAPCWNIWLYAFDNPAGKSDCRPFPESWRKHFPGIDQAKSGDWIGAVLPIEYYRDVRNMSTLDPSFQKSLPCLSDGKRVWKVEWRPRFPRNRPDICLSNR